MPRRRTEEHQFVTISIDDPSLSETMIETSGGAISMLNTEGKKCSVGRMLIASI